MAEFILSQIACSTHSQSVYMKSTLILSSHLRLGIPRYILLGLSRQVTCLPTHATTLSYGNNPFRVQLMHLYSLLKRD